ncbi:hypothetical protein Rhopal_006800-T1 [Rhodotorula paludigena]|uniref:Actin-like ATPase domain-containing protein n=1 Tax=Rhodotorula paludigena TaxID=86838 RepID=A0AAV5GZ18_9BASI|nr:hypothetical protein Rhopal_006800-T1 [Rhodotorula paludigena]
MKSYQEIVRTSSKRDPKRGAAAQSPAAAPPSSSVGAAPASNGHSNGHASDAHGTKKGRFHALAKLQVSGLTGRRDKGKAPAAPAPDGPGRGAPPSPTANGGAAGAEDGAAGARHGRYLLPPSSGPHMMPPAVPYASDATYGQPPFPSSSYARPSTTASPYAYPAPSTAAPSSSAAQTATGASTSPTSPNTPTSAAHYYPYAASQPKRHDSHSMASPQSFRSRGSGADGAVAPDGRREPPPRLPLPSADGQSLRHVSGSTNRTGSLPPGAAVPQPPSQRAPSHASGPRSPTGSLPPAPPPPVPPFPPYPPYGYPPFPPPPPPSAAAGRGAPAYPYPYPYPPYPPYPPYGYPGYPPPPPAAHAGHSSTPRPQPSQHPLAQQHRAPLSSSQASFSGAASVRSASSRAGPSQLPSSPPPPLPPFPSYNPYAPPPPPGSAPYGPHPFSVPVDPASSPAAAAVARNLQLERERQAAREAERARAATGAANGAQSNGKGKEPEEGKLSVGIDFGTTFSGIAYGSSRLFAGQIRQILSWPGSYETYRKVPTCILYEQQDPEDEAKIVSWGLEAKNATVTKGLIKCEWFKLLLSPESLRSGVPDPWLPPLPVGKNVVDVIADFLRCIWRYAKRMITEEIGSVVDLNAADVLLTVPAAWDAAACSLMRESAIRAGLVQSSRGGDVNWRDRLNIITEPEAGAIHASTLATLHHLRPSQSFLLCDAGGGTVDTAVYKLMGQLSELEIAEMCVRSGANTGSLFVDLKFEELLRRILKDHPVHLEPASMATFIHAFAEGDKLAYHGTIEDDEAIFRFNCFNVEDSHDPAVGLEFGELAIPGKRLKTEVFDPVIEQVLELLSTQIAKIGHTPLDAIILVGGFAASEYLYTRVRQAFGATVPVIVRPQDCDTATLRGAARYGLGMRAGKQAVSSVISPRSYCMKSKLPAEDEDNWRRPEYVRPNDGGTLICENRLSYLIAKGAVLRKGERLRSRFCKFVKDPRDSVFTAHLYVSNSEELYRYTDEGDLTELCRWTVDLAALPRFQHIAQDGGGYIEFDLALALDSAEVRGVLMTEDGVECGAATFEFLGA